MCGEGSLWIWRCGHAFTDVPLCPLSTEEHYLWLWQRTPHLTTEPCAMCISRHHAICHYNDLESKCIELDDYIRWMNGWQREELRVQRRALDAELANAQAAFNDTTDRIQTFNDEMTMHANLLRMFRDNYLSKDKGKGRSKYPVVLDTEVDMEAQAEPKENRV